MAGLYFEDFSVGQEFRHPLTRTVTEMDNTLFSLLTLNPQPLHIDAHFSAQTEFGQRIFNSLHTLGIMIGMTVYEHDPISPRSCRATTSPASSRRRARRDVMDFPRRR